MRTRSAAASTARIAAPGTPASSSRPRRPKWPFTSRFNWPKSVDSSDSVTFDDYLADFSAKLPRPAATPAVSACLDPDSYVASQSLAEQLLEAGSLGVVFPSVRRPAAPASPVSGRRSWPTSAATRTYRFTWTGAPEPAITVEGRPDRLIS